MFLNLSMAVVVGGRKGRDKGVYSNGGRRMNREGREQKVD